MEIKEERERGGKEIKEERREGDKGGEREEGKRE